MRLTEKQQDQLYAWCLEEDLSIEYGKLSLCDLRNFNYSNVYYDRRYQVHCDDPKHQHSIIYTKIEPAIAKFRELKKKVKRIK